MDKIKKVFYFICNSRSEFVRSEALAEAEQSGKEIFHKLNSILEKFIKNYFICNSRSEFVRSEA